eukprot:scaffold61853_cov74-Phaeocystis_antarctica.AAC.1
MSRALDTCSAYRACPPTETVAYASFTRKIVTLAFSRIARWYVSGHQVRPLRRLLLRLNALQP